MNDDNSQFLNTSEVISEWLDKYNIKNYTINDDLSVDVNGSVNLHNKEIKIIPIKFGKIIGSFDCSNNHLVNLVGSPKTVDANFYCNYNKLTSLAGSPKFVGGSFYCNNNGLMTLTGVPKIVNGNLNCWENPLISLFELNNCKFEGNIYFSVDENNFKQKKMIEILKNSYPLMLNYYQFTNRQFQDIIKPHIEKEILQNKLVNSKIKNKTKSSFI